jgi:CrcB protein
MQYNLLLVGLGGLLGTLARFLISTNLNKATFPYGTVAVNLVGSLFLGILVSWCTSNYWVLFLGSGFAGAFTTFSTLNLDVLQLLQQNEFKKAFIYLAITLFMGLLLVFVGYKLGSFMKETTSTVEKTVQVKEN